MDKLLQSRKELEEEMKKLKTSQLSSVDSRFLKFEESKNKTENIYSESDKTELVSEKKEKSTENNQEPITESDATNIGIGERIVQLEGKKERLEKEISEKEKTIRQKVLKHIFNNYEGISNELGGDIFMESVIGDHNWEKISQGFSNKELVVKWLSKDFDYEWVQRWAIALGNSFNPKEDAGFCAWLRDDKKLTVESKELLVHIISNVEQLRKEYVEQLEQETDILDKHNQQLSPEESLKSPAQKWLDKKYPKETRDEIVFLTIDSRNLEGELELEGFSSLERIEGFKNKLTKLEIINCPKVSYLNISYNLFEKLGSLGNLVPERLVSLSIHNNNFSQQDLSCFSRFINLEYLYIDNGEKERITENIYNRFYGSLEPLKNLKRLKLLDISETDVGSGLEYLSLSLKKIECNSKTGKKCLKIRKELEEATKIEGVTEKLIGFEEGDTKWSKDWYRLAPWRQARDLLGEETFKRRISQQSTQDWLDKLKKESEDWWEEQQAQTEIPPKRKD